MGSTSTGSGNEAQWAAEVRWRATLVRYATAALCGLGVPSIAFFDSLGLRPLAWDVAIAVGAALLNLRLMPRIGPTIAAHLALSILYTVLFLGSLEMGGFAHPSFSWFYVLPMAAAVSLDLRGAWAWLGITLATTAGFWALPDAGLQVPSAIPPELDRVAMLYNRLTAILGLGFVATSFAIVQRRAQRELAQANHVLSRESQSVQLLQHAAVSANEAASVEEAMRESVIRICQTLGWRAGHIYVLSDDGCLRPTGRWHASEPERLADLDALTGVSFKPGEGLPGRAMASRAPEWIGDLTGNGSDRAELAMALGIHAAVAIPVIADDNVLAVLEFGLPSAIEPDERLGRVLSLVGTQIGRVAERTALQNRMRQAQKMEAVGRLASGVAHEINNPMAFVRSNLNQLREEWTSLAEEIAGEAGERDSPMTARLADCRELIDDSIEGAERTIAIVRDVKEFSHSESTNRQSVDLNRVLESSLRVVGARTSPELQIETQLATLPYLSCSPNQLQQVFVNLIVNAIQATEERGLIRLTSGCDESDVWVCVEDDGPGIAPGDRDRLFEPFFTTKSVGDGTGLGLYISYQIVSAHGGNIAVQSEQGVGTRFEVRLPLDPQVPDLPEAPNEASAPSQR